MGASSRSVVASAAAKQIEIWPDLPRSRVGKVLKKEVRSRLLEKEANPDR
jgi:fatty-acyl-CoA synthase